MFDHVVFREPGGMGAQPVLLVDEPAGDLVEADAAQVRDRANTPDASSPAPISRPTSAASACHRPNSVSGVAVWSLAGRVASDASSSARIRNAGAS